jgi:hypothetical protein
MLFAIRNPQVESDLSESFESTHPIAIFVATDFQLPPRKSCASGLAEVVSSEHHSLTFPLMSYNPMAFGFWI